MYVANKPREEFIEVNGLRIHVQEWGDDRTRHALVMLHGYAETAAVWEEVALDLSREFRVIAVDQRGHGLSDRPEDHDYSRTSQVADIEGVVEQLGLRTVTLIGHGMGGANAVAYAADHPDVVTALIVIEAAPEVLRSGIETMRRVLATGSTFTTLDDVVDVFKQHYPYATMEQLDRRAKATVTVNEDGAYTWAFDPIFLDPTARPPETDPGQRRPVSLWDAVERIQCPVMIVRGSETDVLTPEAIQRFARRIFGARVSLIEEAGHAVPTDQPAALSQHIREFLQSLSAAPL